MVAHKFVIRFSKGSNWSSITSDSTWFRKHISVCQCSGGFIFYIHFVVMSIALSADFRLYSDKKMLI